MSSVVVGGLPKGRGNVREGSDVVRQGTRLMAKVTSKGQVTIPKGIRRELDIKEGDTVMFRLGEEQAVMTRIPDLMELAGSVEVPEDKRGLSWDEIRSIVRQERAKKWR